MTWLQGLILALDTETTGVNPDADRVVTVCVGRSERPGDWTVVESALVNPGVPIPDGATAVHGITTEKATAEGADPAEALHLVRKWLQAAADNEVPVVLHNAIYDLTLLDAEFRRHLDKPMPDGLVVVDTLVLFRRFDHSTGSRTLEQLAHRNGIRFPAHDAEADALTALRLLHILAGDNDLLPLVPLHALQERQRVWSEAQQQAAYWRRRGNGHNPDPDIRPWPYGPIQTIRKDAA